MFDEEVGIAVSFSHGTRCAGEIAAARDNNICGVGVAYDSMIAGRSFFFFIVQTIFIDWI